jgi:hypothetical protein
MRLEISTDGPMLQIHPGEGRNCPQPTPGHRRHLKKEETMPKEGSKAPAFCLPAADREKVCLKDFAGKWVVLYFYPKDSTSG